MGRSSTQAAKASGLQPNARRHPNWDKRVSAAYLRMQGHTQEQAAKAVGVTARTVRQWESERTEWQSARNEARDRWFNDVEDSARKAVKRSIDMGNSDLGFKVLERIDPRLAPPVTRVDAKGAIDLNHRFIVELPLETEGQESLPLEQVLGRDIASMVTNPAPPVLPVSTEPPAPQPHEQHPQTEARRQLERVRIKRKSVSRTTAVPVELPDETDGGE